MDMKKLVFALAIISSFAYAETFSYWEENETASLWVNFSSPYTSANTFYVYANGTTNLSTESIMPFFDEFDAPAYTSNWTLDGPGSATIADGCIYVTGGGFDTTLLSSQSFGLGTAISIIANVSDNLSQSGIGYIMDNAQSKAVAFYYAGGAYNGNPWVTGSVSTSQTFTANSTNRYDIRRYSSTNSSFFVNGTFKETRTTLEASSIKAAIYSRPAEVYIQACRLYVRNVSITGPVLTYGAVQNGTWYFGSMNFSQRVQFNVSDSANPLRYQVGLNLSLLPKGPNFYVTNETPSGAPVAPVITLTAATTSPSSTAYSNQTLIGNCTTVGPGLDSIDWVWLNGTYNGAMLTQTVYSSGTATPAVNTTVNVANVTGMQAGTFWQLQCTAFYSGTNSTGRSGLVAISNRMGVLTIGQLIALFWAQWGTTILPIFILGCCYILIHQLGDTLVATGVLLITSFFIMGDGVIVLLGIASFVCGVAFKMAFLERS